MVDHLNTPDPTMLFPDFFDQDAQILARELLGKILRVRFHGEWLMARIIETEAYYLEEKASHASLGFTAKRAALFAPAGTIYMYYSRGGDSLNFSAQGAGNAVLIKSGYPVITDVQDPGLHRMFANNPRRNGSPRSLSKLCAGQTLLCRALGLKVTDWDNRMPEASRFQLMDDSYRPRRIIQTTRLGIQPERDAQLPYRFIDHDFRQSCTRDPTRVRNWQRGDQFIILEP